MLSPQHRNWFPAVITHTLPQVVSETMVSSIATSTAAPPLACPSGPGCVRKCGRDVEPAHVAEHLFGGTRSRRQCDHASLTTARATPDVATPGSGQQGGPVNARALLFRPRGEWRGRLLL